MDYKNKIKERGSILILSILILAVIISIMFAILGIFIPKLKIASDPIKSVIAAFASDSGLEWCLYINRGNNDPPPRPVLDENPVGSGIVPIFEIYYPSSSFNIATCVPSETPLDHRSVGAYNDVARSFVIQ